MNVVPRHRILMEWTNPELIRVVQRLCLDFVLVSFLAFMLSFGMGLVFASKITVSQELPTSRCSWNLELVSCQKKMFFG